MSLNSYDYNEQVRLVPREFNVTISDNDKIISIEEDGALVAQLSLILEGEILKLFGKDNIEISSVELPKADTLEKAYYDKSTQEIVMIIRMGDGSTNELRVDVKELVDVYQEGNGIMIDEENKIHIKINKLSENILCATEEGLGINLSDYATEDDIKEEARLREKYDDQLREDLKEEARIREEEDDAQWDAINRIGNPSAKIEAEMKRALEAESNLQFNINVETNERRIDVANLQSNINALTEEVRAIDAACHDELSEISKAISTESENRATDVANLKTLIDAETSSRITDVANNKTLIDAETSSRIEDVKNLESLVKVETEARIDGDNILENKILEETAKLAEEDSKLKEAIDSIGTGSSVALENEIKERKETDTKLQSDIATVNTNLVEAINSINKNMADGFNTINGGIENEIKPSIVEEGRVRKEADNKLQSDIATVNTNLVEAVNAINKNMTDGFNTINGGIENEIKPSIAEKVPFTKVMKDGVEYEVIVLGNHANLLGYDNEGKGTYNLAMVSKWNKADYGSKQLEINLNGNGERPTYNDTKELALLDDVTAFKGAIALVKKSDLEYALVVDGNECGVITLPKDQFLKDVSYKGETNVLTFVFETSEGEKTLPIDMSALVDVYTAGNGLILTSNEFSINIDATTQKYIEVGLEGLKIVGIDEVLANKVDLVDISTPELQGRKAIVMKNHDTLLGTSTSGGTYNVAMINKWNVVDLGTSELPINLNTPNGVRPTVQEKGQSGEETNKIAYVSDVNALESNVNIKIEQIVSDNTESLSKKVDWTDISTEERPNRKAIALENDDMLLGKDSNGEAANIAMINNWNVVDLGTNKLPINLNTPKDVRPTVQEAGQSGEEANKIAYLSDVDKFIGTDEFSTSEEMSLYGLKKYVNDSVASATAGVDSKLGRIESKFNEYVTTEDQVSSLDDLKTEINSSVDTKVNTAKDEAKNDAINSAKNYTDVEINKVNNTVSNNVNRITSLENRSEHFDKLFGMILEEHAEEPVDLKFYTKGEVDEKVKDINAEIESVQHELTTKVEYVNVSTEENPKRKAILLNNHDTLLGKGTNGNSYNLAMISKWNKADYGSAQLEINLNGKGERPTYNDNKELALVDDLNVLKGTISLDKKSDLVYALVVDGKECGVIALPKDQFLKDVAYDSESKVLSFIFETTEGEKLTSIDMSGLIDAYTAGNGLNLTSNEFSIKLDVTTQKYIEVGSEGLKIVGIDEVLAKKVDLVDISTPELQDRKAIMLKNHDTLLGTDTNGGTYNIAMINKWDVVDLGSNKLPINLNTPKDVRPTVQEAGQSGKEANKIAYVSDVEEAKSAAIEGLEKKVDWTDVSTEENLGRKAILLNNHDTLLGKDTNGSTYNLAMISKWNKADYGSAQLEINLNGKSDRPTYNDNKELALLDDVNSLDEKYQDLKSKYEDLLKRIELLEQPNQ